MGLCEERFFIFFNILVESVLGSLLPTMLIVLMIERKMKDYESN